MKKLLTLVLGLLVVAPASAGVTRQGGLTLEIHKAPASVVSHQRVPARAHAVVEVRFNGHSAQAVWNDSPQIIESAWRGTIATVSFSKKDGPVVLRVASTRKNVRVRATVRWSL